MPDPQLLTRIRDHLEKRTLDDLFCETLNWDPLPGPALELQVGVPVSTSLKLCPVAHLKGLPVYRVAWPESQLPNVTQRRAVHKALAPRHVEHLLCYETSDRRALAFVWAHKLDDKRTELRTLPYELGQPARTTIERIAELRFALGELRTILEPQVADRLGKAFNVQTVTTEFFVGYKQVFADLQARLLKPAEDKVWAHDYALQLLNRLMFLYFIQRKRWLGGDPGFMRTLWDAYRRSGLPKDSFFANWLSVLFFEAFSQKFQAGRHDRRHLPPEIREALATAPYLNGGLFARGKLDDEHDPIIPDAFFSTLFDSFDGSTPGFLERHNFTIAESTPLDVEVAVDPEMIGKVYENLVNVTFEGLTEEDQRGKGGIFYTPRVEIDLITRSTK